MRKALISALVLLSASFVLGATVFREQAAHAAAAVLPVLVTNDASAPVPVQEQGTPTVKALQSGPWQVTAADNPAFQPFHREVDVTDDGCASYAVPAGKRLVLEFVAALVRAEQAEHATADFRVLQNGVFLSQAYSVPLADQGFIDGFEWLSGSEPARVYVGPSSAEEPIAVAGCFATSGLHGHLTMNFSGYLVDLP